MLSIEHITKNTEACLAVPLYLLASNWINGLIAKASGYIVILFNSDLKYVWLMLLLYIGGLAVMISLKTLLRVNSRPIVFYRKAGK